MHRFFADEKGIREGKAFLDAMDAHHAAHVLRLRPGEEIVLMSSKQPYRAVIEAVSDDGVLCRAGEALKSPEPALRITLYQGLPKADKMEWIVQKCTEVGVAAIVPLAMTRCVSLVTDKDGPKKQERWQRIAREAAKQSGRAAVPEVSPPLTFSKALGSMNQHEAVLVPWEEAAEVGPRDVYRQLSHVRDIALVIGPEGGITPEEVASMKKEAHAMPITLGPRILRTETAGLCAAAALLTLWGDMG